MVEKAAFAEEDEPPWIFCLRFCLLSLDQEPGPAVEEERDARPRWPPPGLGVSLRIRKLDISLQESALLFF